MILLHFDFLFLATSTPAPAWIYFGGFLFCKTETKLVTLGVVGEMGEGAEEGRTKAVAIEGDAISSRLRWLIPLIFRVFSV